MTALGHIASVVAIWSMMLFGLRFAIDACGWLRPVGAVLLHMARCDEPCRMCLRHFRRTVDQLHVDLASSIHSPWSALLLFGGALLIGAGYALGSAGDVARLVSHSPDRWVTFDIVTDCIAAIFAVTGMSFVLAATARKRTASFLVSAGLVVTGLGIGVVTL